MLSHSNTLDGFLFMQAILFSDFFLADILTSMSKVYVLSFPNDGQLLSPTRGNENALL